MSSGTDPGADGAVRLVENAILDIAFTELSKIATDPKVDLPLRVQAAEAILRYGIGR